MKSRLAICALVLLLSLTFLECRRPQREGQGSIPPSVAVKIVQVEIDRDGTIFIEGRECPWPQLVQRLKAVGDKERDVLSIRPTVAGSDISGYSTSIMAAAAEAGWLHTSF